VKGEKMAERKENGPIILLTLIHMSVRVINCVEKERTELLFSSREKAEKWLLSHGFVYGDAWYYKQSRKPCFFHRKDSVLSFVQGT
jgi:hypothetical protein